MKEFMVSTLSRVWMRERMEEEGMPYCSGELRGRGEAASESSAMREMMKDFMAGRIPRVRGLGGRFGSRGVGRCWTPMCRSDA